ncbi:DNA methyltransferase [Leucobacter sp. W1153]|uniref:DNA methyltransferase n=1 Tax=Leucobacter sp. W1153 TaxID=3439064 RepID=UPI003F5059ED
MRLTLKEIEARVQAAADRSSFDRDFIFDLLLAYGRSQGNITRLRSTAVSSLNVAVDPTTEVAQKNTIYFKEVPEGSEEAHLAVIEELSTSPTVVRYNTRFVIVTDYITLLAKDTKTGDTLTVPIREIADHFTFFLPWAGMEKAQYTAEAHADVKAAERMAKLFDELIKLNPEANQTQLGRHSLNVFFTRLLFCFFAEDTGIFDEGQFTQAVESLTQPDGSDLHDFLADLFIALDTERAEDKKSYVAGFPYVNGHLFTVKPDQTVPIFNKKARDYLLESGKLLWSEINPDIFGSMFQAIVTPGQRSDLGQHYTSVPNILKTIEPLFLDELKAEFDALFDNEKKLVALLNRIAKIRVFDPACGSGNFLIIAYKELRKLEHAILEQLSELRGSHYGLFDSSVSIENFYGIEIDDFAVEVAILSLWIAKHQMNVEFRQKFGTDIPLIPLKAMGQVEVGNAIRIKWEDVCPNDREAEIYLIGNPPYLGSRNQKPEHKEDLKTVTSKFKSLDYVSAWFIKGADYIRNSQAELAFVSTNSVAQGEQVGLLWPTVLGDDLEIGYAYTSFKWSNSAKGSAGVTCVVVNLRELSSRPKILFGDGVSHTVSRINPYLSEGPDIWIGRRSTPLSSSLPRLGYGSMPNDGGNLLLTDQEKDALLGAAPEAIGYLRKFSGSDEFIKGKTRWCLVIPDEELEEATRIEPISRRLSAVREKREKSTEKSTRVLADTPHRFYFFAHQDTDSIIVPATSSERREYIPIGYLDGGTVISNLASAAYNAEPWVFALLTSRMHMVWTRAVGGKLKTDYRYSNTIVYNNFPVPPLSDALKEELTERALRVLDVREYHSELTLADLYDPDKMPENLRRAHRELDDLVDSIYRKRDFSSDEERLSLLFEMYAKMTEAEGKK